MKTINISEATDAELDWLVATCEGVDVSEGLTDDERYTTDWAQMGPIIEREKIDIYYSGGECAASTWKDLPGGGQLVAKARGCSTTLVAAARCYITLKLGDTAEVPEELAR